jgi:hypothetical protein
MTIEPKTRQNNHEKNQDGAIFWKPEHRAGVLHLDFVICQLKFMQWVETHRLSRVSSPFVDGLFLPFEMNCDIDQRFRLVIREGHIIGGE